MQKRVWSLAIFLAIILIGFVNAAQFPLSDLLGSIAEGTLILLLVFIISFALLFFALNRAFKGNTPIAAVISFALSFGITYWINKSGFDLSGWVYDLGISEEILSILIPILAIALVIFLIWRFRKESLFIFGGFLLASSLFVYEKSIVIVLGIILLLIRLFIGRRGERSERSERRRRRRGDDYGDGSRGSRGGRERNPRMKHYLKRLHKRKERKLENLSPLRRDRKYNLMAEKLEHELRAIERRLGGR